MVKKSFAQYEVKDIIDKKFEIAPGPNRRKKIYYKVLWEGYPESEATWEQYRNLYRYEAVRNLIEKFNQKYDKIINSFPKPQTKSQSDSNPTTNQKITPVPKSTKPKNTTQNSKKKAPPKPTNTKSKKKPNSQEKSDEQNRNVVETILQKMSSNIIKHTKASNVDIDAKQKILQRKLKEKIKAVPQKPNPLEQKFSQSNASKRILEKSRLSFTSETRPDQGISSLKNSKIFGSGIILQQSGKESHTHSTEHLVIIQGQSHIGKAVDQSLDLINSDLKALQKKSCPKESEIKLELADEFIHPQILVENSRSKNSSEPISKEGEEEQFQIKGMMMCKNEYFYLVEQNKKTQILTRAEILNTHPYELICFYEKRINVKPAEINMMVL